MQASYNSLNQTSEPRHPRPFLVWSNGSYRRYFENQPPLPVLASTLVQLDLLLDQKNIDLHAITDVLLEDIGAVLQLLRVSASENRRPAGIKDCVALLGCKQLPELLAPSGVGGIGRGTNNVVSLWQRARLTAEICRTLAQRSNEVDPSDAYLAGLLHEVGRIPATLSWKLKCIDLNDYPAVERCLVREWGIPGFVESTLQFYGRRTLFSTPLEEVVAIACDASNAVRSEKYNPLGNSCNSVFGQGSVVPSSSTYDF